MADNAAQAKRMKVDFTDTIIVSVGKGEKEYILHKAYAVKTSQFFATATSGDWAEAKEKKVFLPEAEPEVFDQYVSWLYTGTVPLVEDPATICPATGPQDAEVNKMYTLIMDLYILGGFLLDTSFCNAVITATLLFKEKVKFIPGSLAVNQIWRETASGCTMQRLLVRWWAWLKSEAWLLSRGEPCLAFADSLMQELYLLKDKKDEMPRPTLSNKCDYHDHNDNVRRCVN